MDQQEKRAPARFFTQAQVNEQKSIEAGRPIYEEVPFIEKWTPGDQTNIIRRPVRNTDREEYPREWAQFEAKQEQHAAGTPLKELPFLTEAQRLEFAASRINTAEELAALPDGLAQQFAGIHGIKRRVQAYLDAAAGNAPMLKLQAELEARDQQLAAMNAQLAEQASILAELRNKKIPDPPPHRKG